MTDEPKVRYSVTGTAVAADGSRSPLTLSVSEPFPHRPDEWQCWVLCPTFAEAPMRYFGSKAENAWEVALCAVHLMLARKELSLVDDSGVEIELPRPAWVRWGSTTEGNLDGADEAETRLFIVGFAVGPDGSRAPFTLRISEPFPHGRFDWQCWVTCPTFRETPLHIYGDEPEFAWCLTLGFVHRMLEYDQLTIVDAEGREIEIPTPDWARWDIDDWAIERGYPR